MELDEDFADCFKNLFLQAESPIIIMGYFTISKNNRGIV